MAEAVNPGLDAVNSMPIRPENILIIVGVCLFIIMFVLLIGWIWSKFSR